MKRFIVSGFLLFVLTLSVYSIDAEKARKAVVEQDYVSALMDYGFTEQQIRAWDAVGRTIRNYLADLNRNGRYASRDSTTMMLRMHVINREIAENDMQKIEQFLTDVQAFWLNELSRGEEAARQGVQAAQEQRRLEHERRERELDQYAQSFGLMGFVDGILETQMEITPNNFETAKKAMIIPNNADQLYSVQNIVDGYVIYSAILSGTVYQVALLAERGKSYPSNSPLDLNSVYKIVETRRFARTLGGSADIIVISPLGPRR